MYAVVTTGGKQYRVEAGSTLVVGKLAGAPGSSVTLDRVLLVGDGETVTVGTPTVDGASVRATVLGEELGPKIVIFKFKQKVKYRRRTGHRQHLTRLHIDAISADGKTVTAEAPAKAARPATKPKRAARPTVSAEEPAAVAAEPEAKPARRTRTRTSASPAAAKAEETAEKKPRTRTRAASSSKATPAKAADKPKPRRTRAKAERAEEE
jgi:large subunit ribosomal protein L21